MELNEQPRPSSSSLVLRPSPSPRHPWLPLHGTVVPASRVAGGAQREEPAARGNPSASSHRPVRAGVGREVGGRHPLRRPEGYKQPPRSLGGELRPGSEALPYRGGRGSPGSRSPRPGASEGSSERSEGDAPEPGYTGLGGTHPTAGWPRSPRRILACRDRSLRSLSGRH